MNKRSFAFAVAFLLVPMGVGQGTGNDPLLVDAEGDVRANAASQNTAPPGGSPSIDLLFLHVTERAESFAFKLGMAEFPECSAGSCQESPDTFTTFAYGENTYQVELGVNPTGFPVGVFWLNTGQQIRGQFIGSLDVSMDLQDTTYNVEVPREWIVNEVGAPPLKGQSFTGIWTQSYSRTSVAGPDPTTGEQGETFTVSDFMGQDAPASIEVQLGGVEASGQVSLTSPTAYRASNGGAATYRFDLEANQLEEEEAHFELVFENVPEGWQLEKPDGILRLPKATPAKFSVLVTTPFGHQHGGTDTFSMKIVGREYPELWASIELGVHFVSPPQPAGHHPIMWFHTISNPYAEANNAAGGAGGEVYMNTLDGDSDGGDEHQPIQGWTGSTTNDVFHWSICMRPELLMGLDFNMSRLGSAEIPLQSERGYNDVVVSGRLLHLGPGDDILSCFPSNYNDRRQTEVAVLEPSEPAAVGAGPKIFRNTLTPLPAGDFVPYEKDTLLVLEIDAEPGELTPFGSGGGPRGIQLAPGGLITLPLDEYSDTRPAGLVGWRDPNAPEITNDTTESDSVAFVPAAEVKEAPSIGLFPLLLAAAAIMAIRRRSQ